jgi:deoxyribodipyrimidine photo-lyase
MHIFWFRRDLRLDDNAGLYRALRSGKPVLPLFIFDRDILDHLSDRSDARVTFIHRTIEELKERLEGMGSSLLVRYGKPLEVWGELVKTYNIDTVFTNRDYEPYAQQRDQLVADLLEQNGIPLQTFKDHVVFEKNEVTKDDGGAYTVFTPYSRKWQTKLASRMSTMDDGAGKRVPVSYYLKSYPNAQYFDHFHKTAPLPMIALADMGFTPSGQEIPPVIVARNVVMNYDKTRNFPAIAGTTKLGIHFRFGTISIREKARHAQQLNAVFLSELVWRDFYSQILWHFPHVKNGAFRPIYDRIAWRDAPDEFERWTKGKTGYPIVDAGMRELAATGYMHNRVRMIVASFLTKHLLIDWRLGEAWFAEKLLDFDLASNSGGWQWAAGCGTDAAPYFRIFNPTEQTKKFDPEWKYIRKWVPEFGTPMYPKPIVDHAFARQRCLETYKAGLGTGA